MNNQSLIDNNTMAQVELPEKLLAQLISSGVLHGSECKCLNSTAKNIIWQTLLNNSLTMEY